MYSAVGVDAFDMKSVMKKKRKSLSLPNHRGRPSNLPRFTPQRDQDNRRGGKILSHRKMIKYCVCRKTNCFCARQPAFDQETNRGTQSKKKRQMVLQRGEELAAGVCAAWSSF
jgi:hypothetical protein